MIEPKRLQYPFLPPVAGCEIFLMAFDLNPVADCLYALRQRVSMVLSSCFLTEFDGNLPLCNTQQSYSPRLAGRGEISAAVLVLVY